MPIANDRALAVYESNFTRSALLLDAARESPRALAMLTSQAKRLPGLVVKGPSDLPQLSEQQRREIRTRFQQGEPAGNIAAAYNIESDMVRQLGRH